MNPEQAKVLREPFDPAQIGKLPGSANRPALDYVGHAAVTDRLLKADPEWTWEPFATEESGRPALDYDGNGNPAGIWIRLTVAGVTRPGYGSVQSGAQEGVKQLISDALRNAAMRFGVALDLWAKEDLGEKSARVSGGRRGKSGSGGGGVEDATDASEVSTSGKGRAEPTTETDSNPPAASDGKATDAQLATIDKLRTPLKLSIGQALNLVDTDEVPSLTYEKAGLLIRRLQDVTKK